MSEGLHCPRLGSHAPAPVGSCCSRWASTASVYNRLLATRPDLVEVSMYPPLATCSSSSSRCMQRVHACACLAGWHMLKVDGSAYLTCASPPLCSSCSTVAVLLTLPCRAAGAGEALLL